MTDLAQVSQRLRALRSQQHPAAGVVGAVAVPAGPAALATAAAPAAAGGEAAAVADHAADAAAERGLQHGDAHHVSSSCDAGGVGVAISALVQAASSTIISQHLGVSALPFATLGVGVAALVFSAFIRSCRRCLWLHPLPRNLFLAFMVAQTGYIVAFAVHLAKGSFIDAPGGWLGLGLGAALSMLFLAACVLVSDPDLQRRARHVEAPRRPSVKAAPTAAAALPSALRPACQPQPPPTAVAVEMLAVHASAPAVADIPNLSPGAGDDEDDELSVNRTAPRTVARLGACGQRAQV